MVSRSPRRIPAPLTCLTHAGDGTSPVTNTHFATGAVEAISPGSNGSNAPDPNAGDCTPPATNTPPPPVISHLPLLVRPRPNLLLTPVLRVKMRTLPPDVWIILTPPPWVKIDQPPPPPELNSNPQQQSPTTNQPQAICCDPILQPKPTVLSPKMLVL